MLAVVAACRKASVNDGWAICQLSCTNGHKKCFFHLVGTTFLMVVTDLSLYYYLLLIVKFCFLFELTTKSRQAIFFWMRFENLVTKTTEN